MLAVYATSRLHRHIPLTCFFLNHRHGAQGRLDGVSKGTLENEFGTTNVDDAIKQILDKGTAQESEVCLSSSPSMLEAHLLLHAPRMPAQTLKHIAK